jgi:clan AA aspartic protease (TIGR02281 family)
VRHYVGVVLGVLIGELLTLGGNPSPADLYTRGLAAWNHGDHGQALRYWSQGAALQPDNALLHYHRAEALAELGHRHSAVDAYRLTLLFDPPAAVARGARQHMAELLAPHTAAVETTVPVESARGVWLASVMLNDTQEARFLVDTGSSVTIVAPAVAQALGLITRDLRDAVELETLAGRTVGPVSVVGSLRLGDAEMKDVPVVVHDPGPGIDGILGNSVLARWRLTLDADQRLLRLAPAGSVLTADSHP